MGASDALMKILLYAYRPEYNCDDEYAIIEFKATKAEKALFSVMNDRHYHISDECRGGGTDYKIGCYLSLKYNAKWINVDPADFISDAPESEDEEEEDFGKDELKAELEKRGHIFDYVISATYINCEDDDNKAENFADILDHIQGVASSELKTLRSKDEEWIAKNSERIETLQLLVSLEYDDFSPVPKEIKEANAKRLQKLKAERKRKVGELIKAKEAELKRLREEYNDI